MKTHLYVGAAVAVLLGFAYAFRSSIAGAAGAAASAAGAAINPTNPNNVFSQAATAITQTATGTPNSLGTWLAETFSSTTRAADAAMANLNGPLGSAPRVYTAIDRDDTELGAAMRAEMLRSGDDLGTGRAPQIDLGTYADTIARDDADFAKFARINEYQAPMIFNTWADRARLLGARGPTNAEFQ